MEQLRRYWDAITETSRVLSTGEHPLASDEESRAKVPLLKDSWPDDVFFYMVERAIRALAAR